MTFPSVMRLAPAALLSAAAALAGCAGTQTDPEPRASAGGPDGRPVRTGNPDRVPVVRNSDPPRIEPKPESGGLLGGVRNFLFGGGDAQPASDTSAAPAAGEHTIRLQTFTSAGHEKRAAAWVSKNLARSGLRNGFVVNQGDQSIICYGRYPAPRTGAGGQLALPADMVQDRAELIRRLADPEAGSTGDTRFDFVPTPVACDSNPCRIEDARGEWTLYWMSVYGEADSKLKAQQIAEEIRREMKIPCFVVRNDQQYMICVGDLPLDALEQRAFAPVNAPRKADGTALVARSAGLNYIANPKSAEAHALWERFHDFLVNGRTPPVPAAFRDRNGKNLEPQSQWIRIPDLRGRRGSSGLTVDEESFLPGPRR